MSSFTSRNRLSLQVTGSNLNVWGNILNDGVFALADFALDGVVTISTSGPTTLSTANGEADQARGRIINVTATAPATITIPSVEKWYIVRVGVASVSVTNGSSLITLPAGSVAIILTDGASIWQVRTTDLGGSRLQNVGPPTSDGDAATKRYVDQTAFNMASGSLPGQSGNAGKALVTDGTVASWQGPFALINDVFVDVPGPTHTFLAANSGKVHRFTNATGCVATLPNDMPAGWNAMWRQLGSGQVTFATASGAIRRNRYNHTKSSGQYSEGSLSVDENVSGAGAIYILSGDTGA